MYNFWFDLYRTSFYNFKKLNLNKEKVGLIPEKNFITALFQIN